MHFSDSIQDISLQEQRQLEGASDNWRGGGSPNTGEGRCAEVSRNIFYFIHRSLYLFSDQDNLLI